MTISTAQFFLNITAPKAVQGGVPAGAVLNSPQRTTLQGRAFGLLPTALQNRIRQRQSAMLHQLAMARLAETSPHLLADIGVVPNEIATFDGRRPQDRNSALAGLVLSPLLSRASGATLAFGNR